VITVFLNEIGDIDEFYEEHDFVRSFPAIVHGEAWSTSGLLFRNKESERYVGVVGVPFGVYRYVVLTREDFIRQMEDDEADEDFIDAQQKVFDIIFNGQECGISSEGCSGDIAGG